QRRRNVYQGDAAEIRRCRKAGHVADDPSAERDERRMSIGGGLHERVVNARDGRELFVPLAVGNENRFEPARAPRHAGAMQPPYVTELVEWGTRFDRDPDGHLSRGREAAHSVRRVLHAGDTTGREIARVLWNRVSALPSVETANHALVTEVLVEDGCITGVRF